MRLLCTADLAAQVAYTWPPETVTGTAASGCCAGPLITAPVSTLNFDPWHGQDPLAGTVHCMCVQIAVWQTTVPFDAARMTGPDGALTLIDPAAVDVRNGREDRAAGGGR